MKLKPTYVLMLLIPVTLAMAILVSSAASGQEVQPHWKMGTQSDSMVFTAQKDTYVSQLNPSSNYGNSTYVYVSRAATGHKNYILLGFNISSLPTNAEVVDATL